jgi:hypothetical protein
MDQPLPARPAPPRNRALLALAVFGGLAFGGGGASAWFLLSERGIAAVRAEAAPKLKPLAYVKIQRLTVPLSDAHGSLTGYVTLDLALDVVPDRAEFVKQRIPMIRHQINALVYARSFALPDNPARLDIAAATPLMLDAANAALETPAIRSLSIVSAMPS